MGGEDRAGPHGGERLVEVEAGAGDEFADAFGAEEAGVSLVHVEDVGVGQAVDARVGAHGADTADAGEDLLLDPVVLVAAVEAVGDPAQLLVVGRDVGVEQQQWDAPDLGDPDPRIECASARHGDLHERCGAVGLGEQSQRQALRVVGGVVLHLPTVGAERLPEVAGAVEQADADERQAEIGGGLQVVAGEDAETAGVVRQNLGDTELHGEVGDAGGQCRAALLLFLEPAGSGEVVLEVGGGGVEPGEEVAVLGERVESGGRHLAEQPDGVVAAPAPQVRVDRFEQVLGLRVPRPSEVGRQAPSAASRSEGGSYGEPAQCFHGVNTTDRGRFVTAGRPISRAASTPVADGIARHTERPRGVHTAGPSLLWPTPRRPVDSESAEEQVQQVSDDSDQTGNQTHVFFPSSCLRGGCCCLAEQTVGSGMLPSDQLK